MQILNKKQIKEILNIINQQFNTSNLELDYAFLKNKEDKIFIVNKEIGKIDLTKLRINSMGLYFGQITNNSIRLSVEGSQLIGKKSSKNVLELNKEQIEEWLKGNNLKIDTNLKNFVLIKYKDDFFGTGQVKDNILINYLPKERRLNVIAN